MERLTALTQVSDHLPVVADYTTVGVVPEPGTLGLLALSALWFLCPRRRR